MESSVFPTPNPAPSPTPLDPSWIEWIAENRLRNCSRESIIAGMVEAGIDKLQAASAVDGITSDPCFRAATKFIQLTRKLESVMGNLQKVWELAPDYKTVDKRSHVPREEFIQKYCIGCRPVVLTDFAKEWPAMHRWTPQYLKDRFGEVVVEIQDRREADRYYEPNKLQHLTQTTVAKFVDRVLAAGLSNDFYLTANNDALRKPGLSALLEDVGALPEVADPSRLRNASSFWFGPAGTVTPLHHDTVMLFHTQVVGRKRWRFISPLQTPKVYNYTSVYSPVDLDNVDLSRYPDFADATVFEVVVEPGETLFLPLGWWHQVTSLDICISFSFTNLDLPNIYKYAEPNIQNWWPGP